jgi:hypothetical protein
MDLMLALPCQPLRLRGHLRQNPKALAILDSAVAAGARARELAALLDVGRAKPAQEPRPVPRLETPGPNQVWSWDLSHLPTSVRGVWLYLYLVVDVRSRLPGRRPTCRRHELVAWDGAEREEAQIAASHLR